MHDARCLEGTVAFVEGKRAEKILRAKIVGSSDMVSSSWKPMH